MRFQSPRVSRQDAYSCSKIENLTQKCPATLTRLPAGGVPDDLYERVRVHFSEKELSDLTFVVMAINAWNRAGVAFRSVPGSADKLYGLDKAGLN